MLERLEHASRWTNTLQQTSTAYSDELKRIDQAKECLYEMITAKVETDRRVTCASCRPFYQWLPNPKCYGSADHSDPINLARCATTLVLGEVPHLTIANSRWEELAEQFASAADGKALLLARSLIQKHFDHGLDLADSAACLSELTQPSVGMPLMQQPSRARVALNSAAPIAPSCHICSMCKAAECNHDTATIGIANAVASWARKASNLNTDSDKQIKQCLERLSDHVTERGSDPGWLGGIRQAKIELGIADPGTDDQATMPVVSLPLPRNALRQIAPATTSDQRSAQQPHTYDLQFCGECCHMDDTYRCSGTAAHANLSDLKDLALQRSSHAGPDVYRQAQADLGRLSGRLKPESQLRSLVYAAQGLLQAQSAKEKSEDIIRKATASLRRDDQMTVANSNVATNHPAPYGAPLDQASAWESYVEPHVGGSYNDYIWPDPGQFSSTFSNGSPAQPMPFGGMADVANFQMPADPIVGDISFAFTSQQQAVSGNLCRDRYVCCRADCQSWGLGTTQYPHEPVHYGMDQGYGTLQESGGVPYGSALQSDDTAPLPFSAYALPEQGVVRGQTHHQQQLLTGYSTQHPSQAVPNWDGSSPMTAGTAPPPLYDQAGLGPGYGDAAGNFGAGHWLPGFDHGAHSPPTGDMVQSRGHALSPYQVQPGASFDMGQSGGEIRQHGEESGSGDLDDQRGQRQWH